MIPKQQIDDGGPAFARPESTIKDFDGGTEYHEVIDGQRGMSLRDYFAAQAMSAVYRNHMFGPDIPNRVASECYQLADALLTARTQGGSPR